MPIIELKSRGVELDFPDSMSDQEIQDAINKEYPRDGKDVAYELEQFRNAALTGGDLSNPFDQMSDDDYIKLRQYQDKEKKSWSDLFGIAKDTFSTIYDDVIQGAGSSIYNAATGKAGQVAESAKQGMIAGTIGISDLATKIVDPSKPIPTKEDFLKQTKDQPLETMADEAAPFFRKQVKNTEEDYLALVKNEKRKDSESFNRILAMESTLRGAPIEDVAAAFQYVDPILIAGVASAGVKTLAKTLLKKGVQETAQASVEAAAREAAQRAAQQSAETIEGGGMREVVLNQAENLAQGVQSAASLPGKVMQAVKEGAEAIAPGTGASAQAAAMTAAAMTDLGITASVLAGTKTIEKAAEVAGSIARAAKQGASRAGLLERAALDPKISGSARAFANGLAQIQPLFGVGVRTAKQASKGALAGAGVGAGLGYLADGEEGAAAGFGAGAAFGSMFGTLGSLWDVSKEAIGGSTARTRQNAAGDIGRFIAEKLPQEQAGWTSVFNNLAAKSGLEKAAHSMDALKIAEAAGAEVRIATPDEIAKWNNPGWTNHNEISGKQELVLNPKRILSDTAPHETAHIHFNAATNNLFKPEMFKAIVGAVDPVDGKVISEGLFNNEGLARIADDIAKAYGKANESQKNLFSNYADQLRNSLEPENLAKAREAIVDELTATYVGKAFNRSKAGRFNPDRLPLLYRRALDSINEGFFNKLRATIYEKGNVLNMRDISKAFIDDKGRPIRIPELDAIFKKAFTNKLKAVDENTAPVDRIPVNLNDRAIWARSYGNMSGVLNPDNTVKSAAQIDREAAQRWQDMTARLSALPENQRLGLSFGRDDKGKTTMTAKGQISEEAINAILASDSIDQTAKSFLREVFTSIKDPQKTTLDTRYYGVYTRGKGTNKMVAGVKPASQNEILPYSIEFNSKDGIIVRAVDMTKVRDRLADALRKPDFKDAYKDYNQAMRAFRTYLDNLTLDKPVESSIILGGGELGNKRRNLFYDALDFRPAQGDEIRNNPLKRATGKSNPIKSYRIERFTRLSPTRDKFAFEEGTTYTRVKSNFQPDSFTPETLPNGEAWTNPEGYRILKKTGSKLYRVYDKDGTEIGVTSSQDAAIKKAKDSFLKSEKKAESNAFPPDETINPVLQKAIKKTNSDTDKHVLRTVYFKNQSKFEQAVADGRVRKSVPVESFVGKALMLHQPDTALAGSIEFNGNAIVEGTGGAYFPVLFGETGDFWASTESAAKGMAASLNQISDANGGKIAMGLTSAPVTKLFSSTNMSQGIVDTLEAVSRLPRQYGITTSKLNSIIVKASKVASVKYIKGKKVESKLNVKIKISDPLEKNISIIREILKPDNSSFDNRLAFVEAIADETAKALKDKPRESSMFASLILGESNQYALGAIKKGRLSKAAILQAFGDMFSEEFLKSFQSVDKSGHLYAIIEMDGKVEAVPSTKHKSYPFVIRSTSGQKPVVNLLDKAMNWYDVVGIRNSDGFVPEDARLSVFPTSGVSSKKYGFLEVKSPNPEATPVLEITRFQPITPEQDAAFVAAEQAGDVETGLRLATEAAKAAGYDVGIAEHRTNSENFNVFDMGKAGSSGGIRTDYYRPAVWFAIASDNTKRMLALLESKGFNQPYGKRSIKAYLKLDPSKDFYLKEKSGTEIIGISDPNRIKSADPFTYDDAGNLIPLSQRFNPSSSDIRFQPDPSMPSVLNGSNRTRIIKSNSGKFRVYSGTGALLGIRDTQQAAEKLAAKP